MKTQKLQLILTAMKDGNFMTLNRVAFLTGIDSPALAAQLRNIPNVETRNIGRGVIEYRVTPLERGAQ